MSSSRMNGGYRSSQWGGSSSGRRETGRLGSGSSYDRYGSPSHTSPSSDYNRGDRYERYPSDVSSTRDRFHERDRDSVDSVTSPTGESKGSRFRRYSTEAVSPSATSSSATSGSTPTARERVSSYHAGEKTPSTNYVGFATLPDQVHRKSVKKGFEFTLMVVGESGLGKSTLVNSLFLTDLYSDKAIPSAEERINKTVDIERSSVDIEECGVKLRLTVVDTPGFGDQLNGLNSWQPIVKYVDDQFNQYYRDESGLNRKNIIDNRIHCCLYFISPYGHGLRPIDVQFMKALHKKVNIVPVIAKADCLTKTEVKILKSKIIDEIEEHDITIYQFPEGESDDEEFKQQNLELKGSIPFAVIGSNTTIDVNGKKVRGRLYPWGITEVENPAHCDFGMLRNMLIRTHMQDLKEVTGDVHYENYRLQCIKSDNATPVKRTGRMKRESVIIEENNEKDRMLLEKEEELKKMQEMLKKMQAQMDQQNQNQNRSTTGIV
ncbi:septin-2-like isoform X2 [Antedon mediterranea]|uniref:septin-2-like isoform X2 n=1 Tax=Antedon mediterranea TaxID=105859 RepID=UPI003AF5E5C9